MEWGLSQGGGCYGHQSELRGVPFVTVGGCLNVGIGSMQESEGATLFFGQVHYLDKDTDYY